MIGLYIKCIQNCKIFSLEEIWYNYNSMYKVQTDTKESNIHDNDLKTTVIDSRILLYSVCFLSKQQKETKEFCTFF